MPLNLSKKTTLINLIFLFIYVYYSHKKLTPLIGTIQNYIYCYYWRINAFILILYHFESFKNIYYYLFYIKKEIKELWLPVDRFLSIRLGLCLSRTLSNSFTLICSAFLPASMYFFHCEDCLILKLKKKIVLVSSSMT